VRDPIKQEQFLQYIHAPPIDPNDGTVVLFSSGYIPLHKFGEANWNQVARECEVDTMYCEAINAAAPTPYLSSIPPSIHASTYSTHICSKKNSSVYIEIEMKEATPSTPQQIIIISHPNHLPNTFQSTPTSHPRSRCHGSNDATAHPFHQRQESQ
jgi:hypothetical protein